MAALALEAAAWLQPKWAVVDGLQARWLDRGHRPRELDVFFGGGRGRRLLERYRCSRSGDTFLKQISCPWPRRGHPKSGNACRAAGCDAGFLLGARPDKSGRRTKEVATFGTTTPDLLALSDWLGRLGITQVAMESTGVYWRPIYYILEADFEVMLVNARHVKRVPGRKTDLMTPPGWRSCSSGGSSGRASCPPAHPRAAGPCPLPQGAHERANLGDEPHPQNSGRWATSPATASGAGILSRRSRWWQGSTPPRPECLWPRGCGRARMAGGSIR